MFVFILVERDELLKFRDHDTKNINTLRLKARFGAAQGKIHRGPRNKYKYKSCGAQRHSADQARRAHSHHPATELGPGGVAHHIGTDSQVSLAAVAKGRSLSPAPT